MKVKKNIITTTILMIIMLFITVLFIINPFNSLKLRGNVEIGNSAFSDQYFYSDVVYSYFSSLYKSDVKALYSAFYDSYEAEITDLYFATGLNYNNLYMMKLSDSDLNVITELYLNSKFISNLKGIERLSNLTSLYSSSNLTKYDLSSNSKLTDLYIRSDNYVNDISLPNNNILKDASISCSKYELRGGGYAWAVFNIFDGSLKVSDIKSINFNNLDIKIYSDINITDEVLDNLNAPDLTGKYLVLRGKDIELKYKITYTPNSSGSNNAVTSDKFLYSKIIEEYNKEYNTSYDKTHELSKEEASKLKHLDITCSTNKIETLEGLEYYTGLETLKINNCGLAEFYDYSFKNLKKLDLSNNDITEFANLDSMFLEKINLSNNANLINISAASFLLEEINIDNDNLISNIMVLSPKLSKINGIEKLDLQMLVLPYSNLTNLDITNMNNLQMMSFANSNITKNNLNILVGQSKGLNYKLKMPEAYYIDETYNEDDYIATIDNNIITANNVGETVFTKYYNALNWMDFGSSSGPATDLSPVKVYVNVYNIKSSKFLVNKEFNYIYTKDETNDNVIKRYVKIYGDSVKKIYDDKKKQISIEKNDEKIFTFDIVSITSDDYEINNNIIKYKGDFDINKIKITNATANIIDDKLQLTCNGALVDTFTLEKGK